MKQRIRILLTFLILILTIGTLNTAFADEASDETADVSTDIVESSDDTEESSEEAITLEDYLGDSEGIVVDVPLSEEGEIIMEPYDTIEIASNLVNVQDYDVEAVLDNLLSEQTTYESIEEGTVEEGDVVVIDFSGVLDGQEEPFEGGTSEGYSLLLGSGNFIPGFEEQIAGHEIGETFDIHVTFPDAYTEDLAGKDAIFTITIHSKTVTNTPELNDEFVQVYSAENLDTQLDTVEELKEYIRNDLYEYYLKNAIFTALFDKAEIISYPEEMFNVLKSYSLDYLSYSAYSYSAQGMGDFTEDMIAKLYGYNSADDYAAEEAVQNLDVIMTADYVAADLGIEVTDEEVVEYFVEGLSLGESADDLTLEELTMIYGEGAVIINQYNLLIPRILEALEDRTVIVESAMTYQDFMLADVDADIELDIYVQKALEWNNGFISVYAADPDGGYYLHQMQCTQEDAAQLLPGTKIHVEGRKADDYGEIEISDAVFSLIEDGDTYQADVVDATAMAGTSQLVNYMNQAVSFHDVTVIKNNAEGFETDSDDLFFEASIDDVAFTFIVDADMFLPDSDVYQTVQSLEEGDVIDVEGYLYWHAGASPVVTSVTIQ